MTGDTPETIQDKLSDLAPDDRLLIAFPFDALRGAPWGRQLVSQGFLRIFAGGKIVDLEGLGKDEIEALSGSEVLAVVDRLLWGKAERGRVADSIATAFRMGDGRVSVVVMPDRIRRFSSDLSCPDCPGSAAIPPATPNLFSFNSPVGACPHARGFGRTIGVDMESVIPDHRLTISQGAIKPWGVDREEISSISNFDLKEGIPIDTLFAAGQHARRKIIDGTKSTTV